MHAQDCQGAKTKQGPPRPLYPAPEEFLLWTPICEVAGMGNRGGFRMKLEKTRILGYDFREATELKFDMCLLPFPSSYSGKPFAAKSNPIPLPGPGTMSLVRGLGLNKPHRSPRFTGTQADSAATSKIQSGFSGG